MSSFHKDAAAYFQIVMGVGYISLFATWNFCSPYMNTDNKAWSGLLALFSLSLFFGWVLLQSFVETALAEFSQSQSKLASLLRWMQELAQSLALWLSVWVLCVVSAVGSVSFVGYAFFHHLIN